MKAGRAVARNHEDRPLFWMTLAATLLGLLFIFDAGYVRSIEKSGVWYPPEFVQQVSMGLIALGGYWLAKQVPSTMYRRFAILLWFFTLVLLILPKTPLGATMNGATRWFMLGRIRIQPSEFAKVGACLLLASTLSQLKPWHNRHIAMTPLSVWLDRVFLVKLGRAMPFLLVFGMAILIETEPDMGTAMVLIATGYLMLIAGGVSLKSLLLLFAAGSLAAIVVAVKTPYRLERIMAHSARWEEAHMDDVGYQTVQAEIGLAIGGFASLDFGGGRTKHMIPAPTTDFIMATVGEETGFVGAIAVFGLMAGIVSRFFVRAKQARDRFSSLFLIGVGSWIGLQAGINFCMANGLLWAVGVPMPFFSSGGSSLIALWAAVGISQSLMRPLPDKAVVQGAESETRNQRRRNGRARISGN